ncbi:MAG: tetratricopeptide repeat protein, partial [Cytophagaceae bacterium]|nr:tetratricopeptide repeat protein [Gemmatimonadaceae bacterium]
QRLLGIAQLAGRYADAEELCGDLMREPSVLKVAALRVAAGRTRLEVRAQRGESPAITVQGFASLLLEARASGAVREEVLLLTGISDIHARQGSWTDAQRLARAARDAAMPLDDVELRADTIVRLGTALLDTDPASALRHFEEASELYTAIDHRFGLARCLVNIGIARQRVGANGEAEAAYREALAMAEAGHIVDLAGLAALNLGVLLTRTGRYEHADAQFQDAMRCFRKVKSEPRRLATLYNLAHLAHEQGDAAKAHDIARTATDLAGELGMEHVRVAALARMGLAAIALGTMTEVEDVRRELVGYCARTPGWFKGRESVEAFLARYALQQGAVSVAAEHFRAAAAALRTDPYDAAWMVAECAGLFRASRDPELRGHLAAAHRTATELGYVPLVRRLGSALRVSSVMPVLPS